MDDKDMIDEANIAGARVKAHQSQATGNVIGMGIEIKHEGGWEYLDTADAIQLRDWLNDHFPKEQGAINPGPKAIDQVWHIPESEEVRLLRQIIDMLQAIQAPTIHIHNTAKETA